MEETIRWMHRLRSNKLAMAAEIVLVLAVAQVLLVWGEELNGGTLRGGLVSSLGIVAAVLLAWVGLRLRRSSWRALGLARPRSWPRTVALSFVAAVGTITAVVLLVQPIVRALSSLPPDASRFDALRGNLPLLLVSLVGVWVTAAFGEEMLVRGFLMNRLADLCGQTKLGWTLALLASSGLFGLQHFYQGPAGMLQTGAVGLLFGGIYLAVGRNLWVTILAHGYIDTLSFISIYASSPPGAG